MSTSDVQTKLDIAPVLYVEATLPNGTVARLILRNTVLTETVVRQDIYWRDTLWPIASPITERTLVLKGDAVLDVPSEVGA